MQQGTYDSYFEPVHMKTLHIGHKHDVCKFRYQKHRHNKVWGFVFI